MANNELVRGDVVSSNRFRHGVTRPDGRTQVGVPTHRAQSNDPSRATARYLVVHVLTAGRQREVTALRLDNCELTDEIVFETNDTRQSLIPPSEVTVLGHYDLAPVLENAALILHADGKRKASDLAFSVLGFVPTNEPAPDNNTWKVEGFSFRPVNHPDVVGVCELITANSGHPIDLQGA
ncbi:MAG: hypothetical protein SGJ27_31350 [Candidatus Melainabacteria bacterium]|nr:hypothetical protein [Candidatus Melainabacteria bacterium]